MVTGLGRAVGSVGGDMVVLWSPGYASLADRVTRVVCMTALRVTSIALGAARQIAVALGAERQTSIAVQVEIRREC